MSTQLGQVNVKLGLDASKYEQGINAAKGSISSLGTVLGSIAGIGAGLTLAEMAKSAMKASSDFEQASISFEVMLGSAEKAQKLISEIQNMANVTPFETQDLNDNAKVLLNFGETLENIIPDLQMLGNISGGNKEKMNSLTLAFAQMQASGRLMGQDLLQMINAGFNPLQEISRKTGKSIAELKDQMEKGGIGASMVKEAFQSATQEGGRFFGMMDKKSKSLEGELSTMNDAFTLMGRNITDGLLPATKGFVEELTTIANAANDNITKFKEWAAANQGTIQSLEDLGVALAAIAVGIPTVIGLIKGLSYAFSASEVQMALAAKAGETVTFANSRLILSLQGAILQVRALSASLLTCPWTWVAAGITAVGLAFYAMYEHSKKAERAISDINARTSQQVNKTTDAIRTIKELNSVQDKDHDQKVKLQAAIDYLKSAYPKYADKLRDELVLKGKINEATAKEIANEITLAKVKELNKQKDAIEAEKKQYINSGNYGYSSWKTGQSYVDENDIKQYDEKLNKIKTSLSNIKDEQKSIVTSLVKTNIKDTSTSKPMADSVKTPKAKTAKDTESPYDKAMARYEAYISNEEVKGVELTANQKLAAYRTYLDGVKKTSKEETDFLKGKADLQKQKKQEALESDLADLEMEKYAKMRSEEEIYQKDLEIINKRMAAEQEGSIKWKQVQAQREQMEIEHQKRLNEVKSQAIIDELDAQKYVLDEEISNLDYRVAKNEISLKQKLEQQISYLEDQKKLDEDAYARRLELVKGNTAEEQRLGIEKDKQIRQDEQNLNRARFDLWQETNKGIIGLQNDLTDGLTDEFRQMLNGQVEFSNAFKSGFDVVRSAFADMTASMVKDWLKSHITMEAITKATALKEIALNSKSAIVSAIKSVIGIPIIGPVLAVGAAAGAAALIAKYRENGGPVEAGQPYIVGEKRPELFIPRTSGTIIPNLNNVNGSNITVQVSYSVQTMDSKGVKDVLKEHGATIGDIASKQIQKNQRNWR